MPLLRPPTRPIPTPLLLLLRTPKPCRFYSTDIDSPHPPSLIHMTDIAAPNSGRIRLLALNRPAARNAISKQLLHELRSHIDAIAAQYGPDAAELPPQKRYGGAAGKDEMGPVRALIISSAVDSCFCAGADLKERRGMSSDECVVPIIQFNHFTSLLSLSDPSPKRSRGSKANNTPPHATEPPTSSPTSAAPSRRSLRSQSLLSPPSPPPRSAAASN